MARLMVVFEEDAAKGITHSIIRVEVIPGHD
jgi:hypothetical protein